MQGRLVGDEEEGGRIGRRVAQRHRAVARRAAGVGLGQGEALVLAAFDSANVGKDPLRREVAA